MKVAIIGGGPGGLYLAILLTVVTLGVTVWVLSPGARKLPAQDYQPLSFAELGGFPYDPKKSSQVPERVQQLRQRKFRLEGFMLPIEFTGRKVRTFILSKEPARLAGVRAG